MPVAVSYPGVYIQEIPSGVHTIAGVSTSVTAFVGRAFRGPVNMPTTVNSYADYQRFFGGLNADSTISYSVRDFFQNGGGQGVVVRVFSPGPGSDGTYAEAATIVVSQPPEQPLILYAALEVADAAWLAALQPGSSPTTVRQAALFASSGYRTRTAVERNAASVVANAVTGSEADAYEAAGNALTALGTLNIAGVDLSPVAAALAAGWAKAADPAAQAADVSEEVGNGLEGLREPAADAAARPGATPLSVMRAASAAAVHAVAAVGATPSLTFAAANPGDWANGALTVAIDQKGIVTAQQDKLLNVTVTYADPGGAPTVESFLAVSVEQGAGPNRLDAVLAAQSNFITFTYPAAQPVIPNNAGKGAVGTASGGKPSDALTEETLEGSQATKTGMYALELYDLFNILVIPPDTRATTDPTTDWYLDVYQAAAAYCLQRRAFLIIDPPFKWTSEWTKGEANQIQITDLHSYGPEGENAAVYFPHLMEGDPLMNGQPMTMPPSGAIAGIYARTDAARGVWKAPAGITDGAISGVIGLELKMTDADNGFLNPQGINALRSFPTFGSVVWGARTLWGSDARSDDYKYVPVRRLVLYLEESLYRGTQWAVFEPNAEPLWASLRLAVGGFMGDLYRQGAFAGASAKDAYFVACDATTTTQNDIDLGIVNVTVGFAPLKPAEFVVLTIQQIAGPAAT
ncbi:MAG TPA: phage tail sheath C-terminal domain-containing protein [Longimicrobium sp.]|jgi:hypothetical protein|uniref:phage tail sheath family protein n=1 Tax=Longimicrobium sp. TaxID=2029185 RepID=UPI002ED9C274